MNKIENTFRKVKSKSVFLCKIYGHALASIVHIIFDRTTKKDIIYITSHLKYNGYKISLTKKSNIKIDKGYTINNEKSAIIKNEIRKEMIKNEIRKEMIKNYNISVKELAKSTGFSQYTVSRYYMKIRRELF